MKRAVAFAVTSALAVASASPAHAKEPDNAECIKAADDGQRLRDEGKLKEAREQFITCASKSCPGIIAKECSGWLQDAERDIPTVTFRVLDEHGKELLDVPIFIDGDKVSDSIEAIPVSIDPGEHVLRTERAGHSVESRVLLRPGEKNRILELAFPRAHDDSGPSGEQAHVDARRPFHVPLLGWIGAGVAVAGGVTTALFAISANGQESDLRASCAPSCPSSDKSSLDTKVALANVALGVGVVGLGVAVVSTILANTGSAPPPAKASAAVSVDVGPGSLGVHGSF